MPVAAELLAPAGRGLVGKPLAVPAELPGDAAGLTSSLTDPTGPPVRLLLAVGVVAAPDMKVAGPAALPGAGSPAGDPVPESAWLSKALPVLLPGGNKGPLAGIRADGVLLVPSAEAMLPSDVAVAVFGCADDCHIGCGAEPGLAANGSRRDGAGSGANVDGAGV